MVGRLWQCGPSEKFVEAEHREGELVDINQSFPNTYGIGDGGRSIKCLLCGTWSHNPNDVREKYCPNCHSFHDDVRKALIVEGKRLGRHPAVIGVEIDADTGGFKTDLEVFFTATGELWKTKVRHHGRCAELYIFGSSPLQPISCVLKQGLVSRLFGKKPSLYGFTIVFDVPPWTLLSERRS